MPTQSKFTEPVKKRILEYLRLGASRQTAAHASGVNKGTLTRWMQDGETSARGSAKRKFYEDVLGAESEGNIKALRIVSLEMENDPKLAWRYLERREPGYAPPMPQSPSVPIGPVVVQLAFSGRKPLALESEVIEAEVVD